MDEERIPRAGEFYKHFKDKLYQIIGIAYHSETKEKMVVYQALYGDFQLYVRPYAMFMGEVDHVKYPNVTQKYRFEKVELTPDNNAVSPAQSSTAQQVLAFSVSADEVYGEYEDEDGEGSIDARLLQFLEAEGYREKMNVLTALKSKMDARLLNDLAASMDVTLPEGDLDKQYDSLKSCVAAHAKYEESNRLR